MIRWTLLPALTVALALPQDRPPQQFRLGTHGVMLNVAVFEADRVVGGLGVEDFEVFDNGVRQTISSADRNVLPIDLRLVFDTSGSISEDDLAHYLRAMRQVAAALAPDDRCEIITFNSRVADAASRQSPPIAISIRRGGPDGTAFFDAVSLAMVTVPALDRRQITIVLSDASDNASFFDETTLLEVARRTDAVVYTVLPGGAAPGPASIARLRSLSLLTGGRLIRAPHERLTGAAVIRALDEFRHSYVLRYTLAGTPLAGWHTLEVKVRRPGRHRIRARAGYFG
jgi:VWFA-related protein